MNTGSEEPDSSERPRPQGRGSFFNSLKRWWRSSWLAGKWWRLADRVFDWWHPASDSAYPGYGYYGHSRRNRLSRAWGHLLQRIRSSRLVEHLRALLWRWHDWWHPPSKSPYPGYGYYGRSRSNRLSRAWRHLVQRIRRSRPVNLLSMLLGVCTTGGIRLQRTRIRVTDTTACPGEADLH